MSAVSGKNLVLFYVPACATAPGSAELAGSLNKGDKQTAKGLLSKLKPLPSLPVAKPPITDKNDNPSHLRHNDIATNKM